MFDTTKGWLGRLGVAGIAAASLGAVILSSEPARAEVDLSIAIPGWGYYTPPPAYYYGYRYWDYPVTGGIYLGFGHYHDHYW